MNSTTEAPLYNTTDDGCDYYDDYSTTSGCDPGSVVFSSSVALPVLLYLVFFLGLLGNATVIWVLLRYMKLKTMTDVCLLNLAMSDLIMVLSLPLWAYNYHHHLGLDAHVQCKVMTGIYQLGFYSGTLFVTLLSVDRYLAIVHAMASMRAMRTLCYGTMASIAIWLVSITMAIPQVVFAQIEMELDDDGEPSAPTCEQLYPEGTEKSWKLFRNFGENTAGLFVCLPVTAFCYARILSVLQRSRNSKKDKAMKLILVIVCVFVICWVPYNIIVFLQTLQLFNILNNCEASKVVYSGIYVTQAIALAHCCVNPVIYAFVGEKFRKSLVKVLSRYPLCKHLSRRAAFSRGSENETSNTPVRSEFSRGS